MKTCIVCIRYMSSTWQKNKKRENNCISYISYVTYFIVNTIYLYIIYLKIIYERIDFNVKKEKEEK